MGRYVEIRVMDVTLETENLTLRQISNDDWVLFNSLQQNSDVMKYVSDPRSENEIFERFTSALPNWEVESSKYLCLCIIENDTNEKVGIIGFSPEWTPYKEAEVGFMILPMFQGKGYAKESLTSVIDFVFKKCGFRKLKAVVVDSHFRCINLLKNMGFVEESILRNNIKLNGRWHNDLCFVLIENE